MGCIKSRKYDFYVYRLSSTYPNCPWTKEGLKKIIAKYKSYGKNSSADTKAVIDDLENEIKSTGATIIKIEKSTKEADIK